MKWFVAMLWLGCLGARGADVVTLAWDASASDGVAAYRMHYGTNAAALALVTNAGLARTQTVAVPFRGRWFFAATAVDTNGVESAFSNVVEWEARPEPPVIQGEAWVRLTPVIERSGDLTNWASVAGAPTWFPATNAQEFFTTRRLEIERVERVSGQ
jgi:hypothetical protein